MTVSLKHFGVNIAHMLDVIKKLLFYRITARKETVLAGKYIFRKRAENISVKGSKRMRRFENLDSLLNGSETAKIFFASLPDYVQGAVMKRSNDIRTEDELHSAAEKVMHEFQ